MLSFCQHDGKIALFLFFFNSLAASGFFFLPRFYSRAALVLPDLLCPSDFMHCSVLYLVHLVADLVYGALDLVNSPSYSPFYSQSYRNTYNKKRREGPRPKGKYGGSNYETPFPFENEIQKIAHPNRRIDRNDNRA